jgi:hypothetical protein
MAKGIRINFLSDVKDFLRGTKDVEKELEEVADSLDDVAKDGDKATEKLEKGFKEMAREASKAGKDAQDGLGKGFKGAAREGETAATTIKDEFKSNLSEVTSSFDGSVESMGDLVQGTLGGLVSDLGPTGLVLGAAGAAAVGLVIKAFEDAGLSAEEFRAKVSELAGELIEAGEDGKLSSGFISEQLKELALASEEGADNLKLLKELANDSGQEFSDLAEIFAGNVDGLEDLIDSEKELEDTVHRGLELNDARVKALNNEDKARSDLIDKLEDQQKAIEEAQEAERLYLEAGGAEYEAKAAAIASIDAAYDQAVGSILDFKNEETGVLDIDAFVASIETRKAELAAYQEALATSGLTTEQKQALDDMGIEAASAYLDGIKSGTPEQARVLKESLTEAAKTSSGAAQAELDKAFEKPTEAKVDAKLNTKDAQKSLTNFITGIQNQPPIAIRAKIVDRNGKALD